MIWVMVGIFILFIMICNLNGFRQIKYIHTYIELCNLWLGQRAKLGLLVGQAMELSCQLQVSAARV